MSCSTCYSTGEIDCWGQVIPCPDCYVELDAAWRYHPRSVTIESSPDYRPELFNARYIVLAASTRPPACSSTGPRLAGAPASPASKTAIRAARPGRTIETNPDYRPELDRARYIVLDASTGPRRVYGAGRTWEEAVRVQRRRQGVIKAALTRRRNKAAREAVQA